MSIDERLREGLVRNTEHLVPDLEIVLTTTYARARRRQRVRRGTLGLAAAAAAVVTVWAVDLPGLDDDAVPVRPSPTPTHLGDQPGPLEPGLYAMSSWGESKETGALPQALLDLPEGYFSPGGYAVEAGHSDVTDDQLGDISVWHPVQVLADPCHRRTAADVGPTVDDLAQALVRQTGPSTRPRPVVLDGHQGLALEVTIPADVDLTRCTDEEYSLWRTEPRGDSALGQSHTGVVNRVWILDVDGTRLVVVAALYPDESDDLHQEQIAIAESIHFVEPRS